MGSKFGTDVAKRYGEGSEVLVFLGKRGRKTVRILKNYGGGKLVRIRAPYFFSTEGSFGWWTFRIIFNNFFQLGGGEGGVQVGGTMS